MTDSSLRVFGIDLGTTYSAIAYVDEDGRPSVCHNTDGLDTTPSVVFF
jgi:molecular chaperone DnaK